MAPQASRSNVGFRKSFFPAIPRALERPRSSTQKTSEISPPSTVSNSKDVMSEQQEKDWGSVAEDKAKQKPKAEEEVKTQTSSGIVSAEKSPHESNGQVADSEKPATAKENKPFKLPILAKGHSKVNGHDDSVKSKSVGFSSLLDSGIVFGGNISGESSPTLPTSTTSTSNNHHPTPSNEVTQSNLKTMSYNEPCGKVEGLSKWNEPSPAANITAIFNPPVRLDRPYIAPTFDPRVQAPVNHRKPHPESLPSWLLTQFNNRELADCSAEIRVGGQTAHLYLHGVVVARSPKVRSVLTSDLHHKGADGLKYFSLNIEDKHLTIPAMVEALRVCYGAPAAAPNYDCHVPPMAEERGYLSMDMCLSYLAAGHYLKLGEVCDVGFDSACKMLSVATLETFFAFGLEGALERFDSRPSSRNDLVNATGIRRARYEPNSDGMIQQGIQFLVSNLYEFVLDVDAPASDKLGGIPKFQDAAIGHKRMTSDPRLSKIQFGQLQSSQSTDNPMAHILSTILLSLPYNVLVALVARIPRGHDGWLPGFVGVLLDERENRRLDYIKRVEMSEAGSIGLQNKMSRAYWMESLTPNGLGIQRHWTGN